MAKKQSTRIQGETEGGVVKTVRVDSIGRIEGAAIDVDLSVKELLTAILRELKITNEHYTLITNQEIGDI